MGKSCVFFGHRCAFLSEQEKDLLRKKVIDLITKESVTDFVFGGYGDFDSIAFQIVSEIKKDYPHIRRVKALAYVPKYKEEMDHLNRVYEFVYLPKNTEAGPQRYAIVRRNRALSKECDFMVCYVMINFGGAYIAMKNAQANGKTVVNLCT